MVKYPSFEFDRRRFLGLAAVGVAASAAAAAPFAAVHHIESDEALRAFK